MTISTDIHKKGSYWQKSALGTGEPLNRPKLAQEQFELVNWLIRHDLNSIDWAVKPQNNIMLVVYVSIYWPICIFA